MKRIVALAIILCLVMLVGCNNVGFGPKGLTLSEMVDDLKTEYDVDKYFSKHYVSKHKLPVIDIKIKNPFVSDDKTLILDDRVDNQIEALIYDYFKSIMSGSFKEAKDMIVGPSLFSATEAEENNYKNGIYYSRIIIDEIDIVDKDDLDEITTKNKQEIIKTLNDLNMKEFAIVKAEIDIKHNEKSLSMAPQVGNGEITRYFLVGKKDDAYKIIEVYWEGFMDD